MSILGIPATCYRTENAQIPKSAVWRVLGGVPGKRGLLGGLLGAVLGGRFLWKSREKRHCSQQSPQQSPFSRHSSQHSPQHFWGFGRSQSCSRSLGFQVHTSIFRGKKGVHTTTVAPLFSQSVARCHREQEKLWCILSGFKRALRGAFCRST